MEGKTFQLPEPQRRGARDRWNDAVARLRNWPNGRPQQYPNAFRWMWAGFDRQNWAFVAAIAAGWTALPIALYIGVVGAVIGGIGAVVGLGHIFSYSLSGPAESAGFIAFLAGAGVGFVAGFTVIYTAALLASPHDAAMAFFIGFGFAVAITLAVMIFEPYFLTTFRGYRRMSRREAQRINPLLEMAARNLGLTSAPPVLVSDELRPAAWAHLRAIVLTRGMLGEISPDQNPPKGVLDDDDEITAVLAHELHHWAVGDVVALRFVWAAAWPVAVIVNVGAWLQERTKGWASILIWIFTWPALVLLRFLIAPIQASNNREHEYEADAYAARAGYRLGLRRALATLSEFEAGRTGWEAIVTATHPPIELRLEQLETPPEQASPLPPGFAPVPPH
jgi:Zn-dependent protease with chaperone function